MLIDSTTVLWEGPVLSKSGPVIALSSPLLPSKAAPLPLALRCTQDLVGASSVTLKLQQADNENGPFTDVPGASLVILATDFKTGKRPAWRYLPRTVDKPWLRLDLNVSGSASSGALFAALVREDDDPYEPVQLAGKVQMVG